MLSALLEPQFPDECSPLAGLSCSTANSHICVLLKDHRSHMDFRNIVHNNKAESQKSFQSLDEI